jgi:hypothetical protein
METKFKEESEVTRILNPELVTFFSEKKIAVNSLNLYTLTKISS